MEAALAYKIPTRAYSRITFHPEHRFSGDMSEEGIRKAKLRNLEGATSLLPVQQDLTGDARQRRSR